LHIPREPDQVEFISVPVGCRFSGTGRASLIIEVSVCVGVPLVAEVTPNIWLIKKIKNKITKHSG
jgi:hypothetical protein